MEEKEATSTEDVEEILVEMKDKPIEPAEGVQQPDEEPEIVQPEIIPEISQPKQSMVPGGIDFMEMFKMVMEKIEESRKSSKEDNQSLKEGQESLKADLNLSLIHI